MLRIPHALAAAVAPLALLAGCDGAETDKVGAAENAAVTPNADARLASTPDGNWINLEGRVVSKTATSFVLDYGDGNVTVEMDDWDWFKEARYLLVGDRVSVTGRIDRSLLDRATLEASSVYVHNLGTYFYASGEDEEDVATSTIYAIAPAGAVDATGYVTAIEGREFTIGSAGGSMRVDTSRMANNPLDQEGQPQVTLADRVYVWGSLDVDARERDELMADGVIVLRPDRTKRVPSAGAQPGPEPEASNGSAGNQTGNSATGQ